MIFILKYLNYMYKNNYNIIVDVIFRAAEFNQDNRAWRSNEDGKVVSSQPTRVVDNRNGAGPTSGGYIQR